VDHLSFDLHQGRGWAVFAPGKQATAQEIWQAVEKTGFTPTRVTIGGDDYTGPGSTAVEP